MVASLTFKDSAGADVTNLQDTRVVTLEDSGGNIYTLDITTNNLKVEYTPQGGQKVEKTINGLAAALGKLLTIDGSTAGKSVLAEEVVKQPVVDVLVPALATVGTDDTKKVYTKGTADTSFAKIDASNLTDAANQKTFAEAILPAKDGQKSILVEKLGGFLDATETPYGAQGNLAAKAFLAEKGLKPVSSEVATELIANAQSKKGLADEIAKSSDLQKDLAESLELQNGLKEKLIADQKFKTEIKTQANAQDAGFQKAVKAVMSQDDSKSTILSSNDPVFKGAVQDVISQEQSNFAIPQDSSSPLSWDW